MTILIFLEKKFRTGSLWSPQIVMVPECSFEWSPDNYGARYLGDFTMGQLSDSDL